MECTVARKRKPGRPRRGRSRRGRPKGGPYMCYICGEFFEYKTTFLGHQKEQHNFSYRKTSTYISFENKSETITSNGQVEYVKEENIDIKEEIIKDKKSVKSGSSADKRRGLPKGGPYTCQKCKNIFEDKASFLSHQKDHDLQLEDQKFLLTEIKIENDSEAMDLTYEFEYIEIENVDIKEEILEGDVKEEIIEVIDSSSLEVAVQEENAQYKSKIKEMKVRHKCKICARSYSCRTNLVQHVRFEHSNLPFRYDCALCGYLTHFKSNLSKHILGKHLTKARDMPELKYKCEECDKRYAQKQSLLLHKNREHCENPFFKFQCDLCDYASHYKNHLRRHISCKHLKNPYDNPEKKYKCVRCGTRYVQKRNLLRHKKYACKVKNKCSATT